MKTVHMLIGIPGCGKTTFANKLIKEHQMMVLSTDVVRKNNPSFTEEMIWPEVYRLAGTILNRGEDFIYDATNITPKVRARFVEKVTPYCCDFKMIAYFFKVDWHVCYERAEIRNLDPNEHHIPLDIIEGYNEKIIAPTSEEGFIKIIIVNEFGEIEIN